MNISGEHKDTGSNWRLPVDNDAVIRGELRICGIRILLYIVFICYIVIFHLFINQTPFGQLLSMLTVASIWFVFNATLYLLIKKESFQPWMAAGSVFVDVAVVAALNIAAVNLGRLNYADNLVYSLYFLAIALAAIRKKVWVVYSAGILSAVSYLAISLHGQQTLQAPDYDPLFLVDQQVASVSFLDQLVKSLALAVVGWTVAHVTSKIKAVQNNYLTLFNNVPDGIVLTSGTGAIETVNQSLADMLKQPLPQIIGRPVNSLFETEYEFNRENDVISQRTSSTSIPVSITESSLKPRKHITQKILSVRNMSPQEELREQISLVQKTEALGQIARGLAHDFNNLLGGILGAVSLIRSKLSRLPGTEPHDKLRQHATVIQECTENARDIIRSLLALSRASSRSTISFDIHDHLDKLRDFIRKAFGDLYKVTLNVELDEPLYVEGDENTIFQALLNICINARESMANGGLIQISVSKKRPSSLATTPAYFNMISDAEKVRFVEITVSDQGHGMDEETQRQCIDPFFSTKETTRRGTGLGLSIAYTIIRHHNGLLNITSRPNQGTKVRVYLPCLQSEERHQ